MCLSWLGRHEHLVDIKHCIPPPCHAAYSMYMILSIFCDAAGAAIAHVLNLPVAPHFENPC